MDYQCCLLELGAEVKQHDEIGKSGGENPGYIQEMGTYWRVRLQQVFCCRAKGETERLNPEKQKERRYGVSQPSFLGGVGSGLAMGCLLDLGTVIKQ